MPINNITRTNTIDEWRIQTNQSAGELNKLETGNYDKFSGSLNIACTAVLSITAQGTPLQVSNNALIGTQLTVGKDIVLGSEVSQTGNLSVGNTVFIYGGATALYVANNVIANGNLLVRNTITTNNVTVNSNVVVVGTANAGYLGVANSGYVGTTLTVIGNTAVGNLTTANSVVADNGRFSNNVTVEHIIAANSVVSLGGARITNNTTTGNLNSTSVVADTARFAINVAFGSDANSYANGTSFVANGGSIVANTARFSQNTSVGQELTTVTINATNSRISGNANAAHFTASQSVVADNARFAINVAFGSDANSYANGTSFVANGGSVVANTARFSQNTSVGGHIVVTSSVVADSLRITSPGTSANISGNVVAGNVNTQGMVHAGSIVSTGMLRSFDIEVDQDLLVENNLTVQGNFVLSGDIVFDTDVLSISTVTPITTTGAGYYGVFRGNTSSGVNAHNMTPSAVIVNGHSYRVSSLGSTTLGQWQARFGGLAGIPTVGQIIVATSSGNLAGGGLVTDRDSDANAYIRWSGSANNWQIRDVFNPDVGTSY